MHFTIAIPDCPCYYSNMNNWNTEFATLIKNRRQSMKMSQAELSERLSITQGQVSKIEANQREVSAHLFVRIVISLEFTVDELFELFRSTYN